LDFDIKWLIEVRADHRIDQFRVYLNDDNHITQHRSKNQKNNAGASPNESKAGAIFEERLLTGYRLTKS